MRPSLRKLCRNQYARAGFLAAWLAGQARSLAGVGQGGEEAGELLAGPIEDVAGEEAATGAEFEDFDLRSAVERLPYLVELARDRRPKTA